MLFCLMTSLTRTGSVVQELKQTDVPYFKKRYVSYILRMIQENRYLSGSNYVFTENCILVTVFFAIVKNCDTTLFVIGKFHSVVRTIRIIFLAL